MSTDWAEIKIGDGTYGTGIPYGTVLPWYGPFNAIPNDWSLCDGTNGTPDLRNRFIIGAGR